MEKQTNVWFSVVHDKRFIGLDFLFPMKTVRQQALVANPSVKPVPPHL